MVYLPDEILEVILCRLPVKCLMRCRCVSKSWLSIISSPYFIKLHLKRSVQTKSNLGLFLNYYNIFRVDFDSLKDEGSLQPVEIDYFTLNYPHFTTGYPHYEISICGSCDGLLCMTIAGTMNNVFLWNPSTKKSIQLPTATTSQEIFYKILIRWAYRFGYDKTNNDYKVVKLLFFKGKKSSDYEIKVYSLKSNSWHSSKKFPYRPKLKSIGDSITNGAMHWISEVGLDSEKKSSIIAFDLGTEKYRVVPQPKLSGSHFCLYLDNLEGCLSATCQYYDSENTTSKVIYTDT